MRPYVLPTNFNNPFACVYTDAINDTLFNGAVMVDKRSQSLKLIEYYWWITIINCSKLTSSENYGTNDMRSMFVMKNKFCKTVHISCQCHSVIFLCCVSSMEC